MFKFNIKDMLILLSIMIVFAVMMIGLDYLGVNSSETISIPSGDANHSMSPTGAMSGTIG